MPNIINLTPSIVHPLSSLFPIKRIDHVVQARVGDAEKMVWLSRRVMSIPEQLNRPSHPELNLPSLI